MLRPAQGGLLPTLCINSNATGKSSFRVEIVFNDHHRIAQSTLAPTVYEFKLFRLIYPLAERGAPLLDAHGRRRIESRLVLAHDKAVNATDAVVIDNLRQGVYLIEVSVKARSVLYGTIRGCPTDLNAHNR